MAQTPEEKAAAKAAKDAEKAAAKAAKDAEKAAAKAAKDAEKAAAKAAKDAEKAAAKADATSASVLSSTGGLIRTYSQEVHGDEFADLAKEFSEHTPGSTIQLA
jgi:hypothetical protein